MLSEKFDIQPNSYKVNSPRFILRHCPISHTDGQEYSVVLVIPDFYDRNYVQSLVRMLLVTMNLKQLCVQQVTRFHLRTPVLF